MNTASRMNYFFSSIGKKHLPVLLACLGGAAAVYAASMTQEGVQYDSNYASDRAGSKTCRPAICLLRKIYSEEMANRPAAMTNPAW